MMDFTFIESMHVQPIVIGSIRRNGNDTLQTPRN